MGAQRLVIGGAAGFWGEAGHATAQLLGREDLEVLVYDYLAEITLSIMARARQRDPALGWATDFVTDAMAPSLAEVARRGIRVVSNAGGMNPHACAQAVARAAEAAGVAPRIAVIEGDDLTARAAGFAAAGVVEMFSGAPFPDPARIASINAYLGALPVAAALEAGADIVITGRVADSALALGACIWRFGWAADDFDRLAAGTLAGHLIECGPQATGGNFTDWQEAGELARIGYPIAEVEADGTVTITKPAGTAGVVSPASVGEQLLYEIGDPAAYVLPDLIADFSAVTLEQVGPDRVRARGARGRPPTGRLKVAATFADGFRAGQLFNFAGLDAGAKARAFVEIGLSRARRRLAEEGAPDFDEVVIERFGGRPAGTPFAEGYEEVQIKIAARHRDARALSLLLKEEIGAALATPPGLHFFTAAGRPRPSPVVRLFSFLIDRDEAQARITLDGAPLAWRPPAVPVAADVAPEPPAPPDRPRAAGRMVQVPLERLAWARSGDKGDSANIGILPRRAGLLPWIWHGLDDGRIRAAIGEAARGPIRRYLLPGLGAMNLVLEQSLAGGGVASLLNDAQGKAYAQRLLALPLEVPAALVPPAPGAEEG